MNLQSFCIAVEPFNKLYTLLLMYNQLYWSIYLSTIKKKGSEIMGGL